MKRRTWLGGAAGLSVGFGALSSACSVIPVVPRRPVPQAQDALGWVRHHQGRFDLFVPCAEMGQHIGPALRRIAAVELGVPAGHIVLRRPSSADIARVKATVGSDSLKDFALPLAQACATLREALAAGRTQGRLEADPRPREQLRSLHPGAAAAAGGPRTELLDIVTGAALYAADMRLPGMAYGRVLRAPVSPELVSRPASWDEAAARRQRGFVAVVADARLRHANSLGLGLVAETPGALERIELALAVRWQIEGGFEPSQIDTTLDIDRHLARGALRHGLRRDALEGQAPWSVDLRIDLPFAAHASIEPRAALAHFDTDAAGHERLQVHTGTQDLFFVRDTLARRFDLPLEQVHVQACRLGGGFGARTLVLAEGEAAVLARAVRRPVKALWTRAQEFAHGFHRPPSSHRVRARVHHGRITDWWHAFTSSHILFTPAAMPAWMQRAADFVGDQGVARGAALPYVVPRQRIEFDALRLPVHGGPWRGLGAGPNGLVVESAVDACAHAAGRDPLAFRLEMTDDPRLQQVLRAVGTDAGWHTAPATRVARAADGLRHGRGLACGVYKGGSRVAVVAGVEVSHKGEVRVTGLWCAHDCGVLVDPDGVRAQVEGCLVWCLGMVLVESLPLRSSGVAATGFAGSPIPRAGQVPPIAVRLLASDAEPSGAGESAMTAGAAAIANAVFDATGQRVTRLPLQAGAVAAPRA